MSYSTEKIVSGGLPFTIPKIPEHVGIGWVIAIIVLLIIAIIFGLAQSTGYLIVLILVSVGVVGAMVYFNQPKPMHRPMQRPPMQQQRQPMQQQGYYGAPQQQYYGPPPPQYYGPPPVYGPPPQQAQAPPQALPPQAPPSAPA